MVEALRACFHSHPGCSARHPAIGQRRAGEHVASLQPESCSIRALVEQICSLCGADFNALVQNSDERLGKDQSYLLDSTSMRQVHGWSDQVTLKQGLQETLGWVNANMATLKTLPWSYQHKT